MPLLNQLPKAEIAKEFTHYAKLHGVPIYFNEKTNAVSTRNWVPEWILDVAQGLVDTADMLKHYMLPVHEESCFMIKLGKPIESECDRGRNDK